MYMYICVSICVCMCICILKGEVGGTIRIYNQPGTVAKFPLSCTKYMHNYSINIWFYNEQKKCWMNRKTVFALQQMEVIILTMINHLFYIIGHLIYKKEMRTQKLLNTVICTSPKEENMCDKDSPSKKIRSLLHCHGIHKLYLYEDRVKKNTPMNIEL